ncbi:uncharacterized protein V6R79_014631 [Siganus canaliculatus]
MNHGTACGGGAAHLREEREREREGWRRRRAALARAGDPAGAVRGFRKQRLRAVHVRRRVFAALGLNASSHVKRGDNHALQLTGSLTAASPVPLDVNAARETCADDTGAAVVMFAPVNIFNLKHNISDFFFFGDFSQKLLSSK